MLDERKLGQGYMLQFFREVSANDSEEGENQSNQDPFLRLNSTPPCGMWT